MYEHQKEHDAARTRYWRAQSDIWFANNTMWRNQLRMGQLEGELAQKQTDIQYQLTFLANSMSNHIANAQNGLMAFMGKLNGEKYDLEIQLADQAYQLEIAMTDLNEKMNNQAASVIKPVDEHLKATVEKIDQSIQETDQQLARPLTIGTQRKLMAKKTFLKEKKGQYKSLSVKAHVAAQSRDKSSSVKALGSIASSLENIFSTSLAPKSIKAYSPSRLSDMSSGICFAGSKKTAVPSQAEHTQPDIPSQTAKTLSEAHNTISDFETTKQTASSLKNYIDIIKNSPNNDLIGSIIPDDDETLGNLVQQVEDFEKEIEQMEHLKQALEEQVLEMLSRQSEYEHMKAKMDSTSDTARQTYNRVKSSLESITRNSQVAMEGYKKASAKIKGKMSELTNQADSEKHNQKRNKQKIQSFKGQVRKLTETNNKVSDQAEIVREQIDSLSDHRDHDIMIPLSYTGLRSAPFHERPKRRMHNVAFRSQVKQEQKKLDQITDENKSLSISRLKSNLQTELKRLASTGKVQYLRFRGKHNPPQPGQNLKPYAGKYDKVSIKGRTYVRDAQEAYENLHRRL